MDPLIPAPVTSRMRAMTPLLARPSLPRSRGRSAPALAATMMLALLLAAPGAARAQSGAAASSAPAPVAQTADCPRSADELAPELLYGRWEARFDDAPAASVLRLARHPEYAGSVRGTLARAAGAGAGVDAQVAGDIDDAGVLTLDESADGRAIDAVWSADLEPGSCGRTFRGTRRDARDDSTRTFLLHKTGELP
jgi:hypothetical protein